jgi:tRNA (mo5U34)-methyltransferase
MSILFIGSVEEEVVTSRKEPGISEMLRLVPEIVESWDASAYARIVNQRRAEHLSGEMWRSLAYKIDNVRKLKPQDCKVEYGRVITVSSASIGADEQRLFSSLVRDLIPWRKGPFDIFGEYIDSEWRSDLKWDRVEEALGMLRGRKVLDIGCNNGYYLFRMMDQQPELLLGVDPSPRFYYQFQLINLLVGCPYATMEPIGIEDLGSFRAFFDVVVCMGVLYHRRDQFGTLQRLAELTRPGGILLLETLVVGDDTPYCLCPVERYAMMRNVWFVPSISIIVRWLKEVGFKTVDIVTDTVVTEEEQRSTAYAPSKSLESFIDPLDKERTVEGYPAPRRVSFRAVLGYPK